MTADNKFAARLRELVRLPGGDDFLRVSADTATRLADLVERVEALRHYDDPTVLLKASELAPILAALDALDGGGA